MDSVRWHGRLTTWTRPDPVSYSGLARILLFAKAFLICSFDFYLYFSLLLISLLLLLLYCFCVCIHCICVFYFNFSHFFCRLIKFKYFFLSLLGRPLRETWGEPPPGVVSGENVIFSFLFSPLFLFRFFFRFALSSIFIQQNTNQISKIVTPGPTTGSCLRSPGPGMNAP